MRRALAKGAAAITILLGMAGCAGEATEWICEDNAEVPFGTVLLFNNVWNKGSTRNYEQCIAG